MLRRGFLKAILGSPFMAAGAAQAATTVVSSAGLGVASGVNKPVADELSPSVHNAADEFLEPFRRKLYQSIDKKEDNKRAMTNIPPSIASKKSWSAQFKQDQFLEDMRALQEERNTLHDPEKFMKYLESQGVKIPFFVKQSMKEASERKRMHMQDMDMAVRSY